MSDPVIHFHGAAGTVTGSCFLIEHESVQVLVDCGLFQGSKSEKELNYRPFPYDPAKIDAIVLTHAHIDHSGLLPKLVKFGYEGPIYATAATIDLCAVTLPDSGYIQESEVEILNKRNRRRGRDVVDPIYTAEDAMTAVLQLRTLPLEQWQMVAPGIRVRLWNAGHLLGSASVEMEIGGGETSLRLLFSGDIGPSNKLLQFDPEAPAGWDYVICESTYGDTDRKEVSDQKRRAALRAEVKAAYHPAGALLIPSFAVERTQELLADLHFLMEAGEIPRCPVIIDSPLATRASQVFEAHVRELENGGLLTRAMRARNIRFTDSVEQSKAIDQIRDFHIVIAASGMCEAGRIRHRLKNWLWREEGTVLLVGYQASGTLGRILEDGASIVRIQGDDIKVRARIRKLDVYSGHADGPELSAWMRERLPIRHGVFLVHGEQAAIDGLQLRLAEFLPENRIFQPRLDAAYRLTPSGPIDISPNLPPPRLKAIHTGHADWHNDLQSLILDMQDELSKAGDDKSRGVIIRRIRRALLDEQERG